MRELDFIDWIRASNALDSRAVPVGPGDDCAVVRMGAEGVLVTTDQVLDGVHFVLAEAGPKAAGRKAMARNLSDIAAMAGVPIAAVAATALPKGLSRADAELICRGLWEVADEFRCPVVGGDVATWDKPLAITVTVFGRCAGAGPVLRSGAVVGDAICVTGRFGGAWQSGRDLTFTPRVTEAIAIAGSCDLHAMIDVSDGLAADLGQLCRASGVGAEILADKIPVHPDAADLQMALHDGEDYELLLTLPQADADALTRPGAMQVEVTQIGTVTEEAALTLVHLGGAREKLAPAGWEHTT